MSSERRQETVGSTVSHYHILHKLGGGGMGVVYEAEDTRLKRHVALKFLPPDLTRDDEAKQRFILEAQAASALDHPNVCTIHEIDETEDGRLFIVMSCYAGETLKNRLENGSLSLNESLRVAVQAARGLACAHESSIVHRDIKPANLMLTPRGEIKILDFGLAKLARQGGVTRTGMILGTVAYMAPEQIKGGDIDPRVDVWALGIVLYEMLTGKHPFERSEETAILNAILNDPPPPIQEMRKDVPDSVIRIIDRSLRRDRESRYATAGEMLADLEQCYASVAESGAIKTSPPPSLKLVRKPVILIPLLLALLGIVAFAIRSLTHSSNVRWARETAIPEIQQLVQQDHNMAAFDLAMKAETYLPNDRTLRTLQSEISVTTSIATTPPGADVFFKEYTSTDGDWRSLGQSPMKDIRLPRVPLRWKIQKAGFATLELATPPPFGPAVNFALSEAANNPSEMVLVPAGRQLFAVPTGLTGQPVQLSPFLIDRFEVTNRQFKEFIDAGGYQNEKYWKQPFTKDGRALSWKEAMSSFRDLSGKLAPSGWELGEYPAGQADFPVGGVSWYEAAAYAEFRGKQLPTLYHWSTAALSGTLTMLASPMVEASNFLDKGPIKVGERPSIGPFGTYDMLGNVREWCWNASKQERWILGGAWSDDSFMFSMPYSLSPFDRSPQNGFRLAKYLDAPSTESMEPRITYHRDYNAHKPISDEVFEAYRRQYAPIRSALNPKVESRDETAESWIKEKVTVEAGYLGERFSIYLFLPKRSTPPYQAAIFFPNYGAFVLAKPGDAPQPAFFDFIVKTGRALIMPVFKGTYERVDPREISLQYGTEQFDRFKREEMSEWRQDLARTIDYLQTRPEIDSEKIAYLGESFGGMAALPLLYLENRLKVAALMSGGLPTMNLPPEIDAVNYVPRTKLPVLLVSTRHDSLLPVETAQKPLMAMLGTDSANKRHVFLEGGHAQLPRGQTIQEVLAWLDHYLGAVK